MTNPFFACSRVRARVCVPSRHPPSQRDVSFITAVCYSLVRRDEDEEGDEDEDDAGEEAAVLQQV